jgi:hypothetical protein
MTNVTVVAKLVDYIRSKRLNHRQFQQFLSDMDSEKGNVLYYTEVHWLSRGQMLKRVYDLKLEINLFLGMKGKSVPQLTDHDWMCDFALCTDITQYLNELNSNLQGMNQLINKMFAKIKAFESKLQQWELQLRSNNMAHFPTLRTVKSTDTKKYAEEIQILQQEFGSRFQDFRKREAAVSLFSTPLDANIEIFSGKFQLEIVDLQCNEDLKSKFRDTTLLDFYKLYLPGDKFPVLRNHAQKLTSLFGSTYLCEQFFSKMNTVKNTVSEYCFFYFSVTSCLPSLLSKDSVFESDHRQTILFAKTYFGIVFV